MTDQELIQLMTTLESDRVERKASMADTDRIREAICAFSNDLPNHNLPGVVFVGVNDNGTCANLDITDQLLRNLSDLRGDGNILPFPTLTVERRALQGCDAAVVIVQPSFSPPVRVRGRTWIRVGPRRAVATAEEERRLREKRRYHDAPFDIHPVPQATVDDLDLELFSRIYVPASVAPEIVDANNRSVADQLSVLRFTVGDHSVPTVLGVVVAGKDPRDFLPGAYVQFRRIEGTLLTDPIKDAKEISGPILQTLRQVDEVLKAHTTVEVDITSEATEIRRPDYPIVALQQLIRNALMHRSYEDTNAPVRINWYSDRIEIQNPGGPFGHVNRENFGRPNVADYRNPHIAEAMKNLGYVQRFGVGIALARKELSENRNPPLEFDIQAEHVLAIVRKG